MISRPEGIKTYTFLHFSTAVRFRINGTYIDANPGACIFYAPNFPQWFQARQALIHNWFHAFPEFSQLLNQFNIPENCILYPKNTEFISEIFHKIEVEYFSENQHKEELIQTYLTEFLILFSRALTSELPPPIISRNTYDSMRRARQTVLSNPERKWTVAEMASLVSLSPSRFHTIYKLIFGTSPLQDVIEARIRYAKSVLLSSENLTLPEVAEKLGYNDQYHFIRQFKLVTGITPGAFRKKYH